MGSDLALRPSLLACIVGVSLLGSVDCGRGASERVAETAVAAVADEPRSGRRQLVGAYEPSGVTQLADGRLLLVEDEPLRPIAFAAAEGGEGTFRLGTVTAGRLSRAPMGPLDDLEAVTLGAGDWIYAITSHSRRANGERDPAREQLLRFRVDGSRVDELEGFAGLRSAMAAAYPGLESSISRSASERGHGLDIEGLAYDPRSGTLWIGLRAPRVDDRAQLVELLNPVPVLTGGADPIFARRIIELDLDRGGVRGLAFSRRLAELVVLSRKEGAKNSKLWLWSGDPDAKPRRVRVEGATLGRAEGVAEVRLDGAVWWVTVADDGDRARRQPASYLLVEATRLRIDGDAS